MDDRERADAYLETCWRDTHDRYDEKDYTDLAAEFAKVRQEGYAAGQAHMRERIARLMDVMAGAERDAAELYREGDNGSGRRHPAPASARQCEAEAEELDSFATKFRALTLAPLPVKDGGA